MSYLLTFTYCFVATIMARHLWATWRDPMHGEDVVFAIMGGIFWPGVLLFYGMRWVVTVGNRRDR